MTRKEHLEWAKKRATELANKGDLIGAIASMSSDLNKHEETRSHVAIEMMMQLRIAGNLETPQQIKKFINDFN